MESGFIPPVNPLERGDFDFYSIKPSVGIDEFIFIKEPLMFSARALSYESFGRCWVDAVIPDVSSR